MNTLMTFLLIASAKAAVLVVLVVLANHLLAGRVAARWRYLLWGLVALRLVLPPMLPSETSLFNLLAWSKPAAPVAVLETPLADDDLATVQPLAPVSTPVPVAGVAVNPIANISQPKPARPVWRHRFSAWTLASLVWLAGMLALLTVMGSRYWRIAARIRRQAPVSDPTALRLLETCQAEMKIATRISMIETAAVQSPALLGIFRPRLLLPPGMIKALPPEELRHVILHELAHHRGHDVAINWLAALVQTAHWFNPLVWLAFRRMRQEQELACDEAVLAALRPQERRNYGRTLVNLTDYCPQPAAAGLVGIIEKPGNLARRIEMIGQYQPQNRTGHWLAAAVLLGLGAISLTDAVAQDEIKKPKMAAKMAADSGRFFEKLTLPGNRGIVIVSEGDYEPRNQGSYSVLFYGSANPEFPMDDFLGGCMRPREDGAIEKVLLEDIDGDGAKDVVVTIRSEDTGRQLAAEAFGFNNRQVQLLASVKELKWNADVIKALQAASLKRQSKEIKKAPGQESVKPAIIADPFLGAWIALSKNHMAISGDLTVEANQLAFSRKGNAAFEVIRCDGQEYILKLDKVVDSGRFMRLGPIQKNGKDEDMEVAYYESQEKALAPRKDRTDNATSWGIYTRKIPAPPALLNTTMRSQPKELKEELDFAGHKETVTILDSNGNGKIEPWTLPRDPDGFLDPESRSGKSGGGDIAMVGTLGVLLDMPFMKHGALWTLSVTADNRIQLQRQEARLAKFAWQGKGSMPLFLLAGKSMIAGSMFEKEGDHWLVPAGDYRLRQFSYRFDENLSFISAKAEPGQILKLEAGQTQTFGPVTEATAKVAITGTDMTGRKVNFTVKTLTPDGYAIAIKTGIMKWAQTEGTAFRILDSAGKEVHKGHADNRNEASWTVPPERHGDFTIEPVFDIKPPFKVTIETAKITMPPANTPVSASGTPLAVPPMAIPPMETAPDFSHYPQTEAFKFFSERPAADNTLLDITAFYDNDRTALLYMVIEKGEATDVREVYDWAHQDSHRKQLSTTELKNLREVIRQLPAKNTYPPLNRLVIVRFREGTTWTSRSFDSLALPEPMRRIYDIVGEREESKRARMAQATDSGKVPLKTISTAKPPNIEIDREKCASLGVSLATITEACRDLDKNGMPAIDTITVKSIDGKMVRLRDLIKVAVPTP